MKLAAFDLDGTLLTENCSLQFCRYLFKKKFFTFTEFFFCLRAYLRHIYLHTSIAELQQVVFDRLFIGKKIAHLETFLTPFLEEVLPKIVYKPALKRLEMFRKNKDRFMILSSAPSFLVRPIALKLGVLHWTGSEYEVDKEGALKGIVSIMDGKKKADFLIQSVSSLRHTIAPSSNIESVAFSDSILDLPFLEAAMTKVVVRGDRKLRRVAKKRAWETL